MKTRQFVACTVTCLVVAVSTPQAFACDGWQGHAVRMFFENQSSSTVRYDAGSIEAGDTLKPETTTGTLAGNEYTMHIFGGHE
jgi:hypothetical protein